MRLPDPTVFQQFKARTRSSVLAEALTKIMHNEATVIAKLQKKKDSHLGPLFFNVNNHSERLAYQRKTGAARKARFAVMDSICFINDVTRECFRQNIPKEKCQEHHPNRYREQNLDTVKAISKSTEYLIKTISAHVGNRANALQKHQNTVATKMKSFTCLNDGKEKVYDDVVGKEAREAEEQDMTDGTTVFTKEIEELKKAEKSFECLSMNIYWFVNNIAEKQRQTYGVYPYFPKK